MRARTIGTIGAPILAVAAAATLVWVDAGDAQPAGPTKLTLGIYAFAITVGVLLALSIAGVVA